MFNLERLWFAFFIEPCEITYFVESEKNFVIPNTAKIPGNGNSQFPLSTVNLGIEVRKFYRYLLESRESSFFRNRLGSVAFPVDCSLFSPYPSLTQAEISELYS